jgi:hypothetical protein
MSETHIQQEFFNLIKYIPSLDAITYAVPNGGKRNKAEAMKLKREGVKSGVWDCFIALPIEIHAGFYLEFKYAYNWLSETQYDFGEAVRGYYCTSVFYSAKDAFEAVCKYQKGLYVSNWNGEKERYQWVAKNKGGIKC